MYSLVPLHLARCSRCLGWEDFPFPDEIDNIRNLLAIALTLFASSLVVGISVIVLFCRLRFKESADLIQAFSSQIEIMFMGGLLLAGFAILNTVLIKIDFKAHAVVGVGFLTASAFWISFSAILDSKGNIFSIEPPCILITYRANFISYIFSPFKIIIAP
jgi:hypothetical protein